MIASLHGELQSVADGRAVVASGPMTLEVLVPAADEPALSTALGEVRTFHTMLYLEGDATGGNLTPRLLGFISAADRAFFQTFITVKGIGPKKALRAMTLSAGEIAAAIEDKDTKALTKLPAVGKRLAETIVAELAGKVQQHVSFDPDRPATPTASTRTALEEDAIGTLMALGERRAEAEKLLDRVRDGGGLPDDLDELIKAMLNVRAKR